MGVAHWGAGSRGQRGARRGTIVLMIEPAGNDDTKDAQCQDKTVPTLLQGSIMDHVRFLVFDLHTFPDDCPSWALTRV